MPICDMDWAMAWFRRFSSWCGGELPSTREDFDTYVERNRGPAWDAELRIYESEPGNLPHLLVEALKLEFKEDTSSFTVFFFKGEKVARLVWADEKCLLSQPGDSIVVHTGYQRTVDGSLLYLLRGLFLEALNENKKIEAIKKLRLIHQGIGLKEAKDLVERILDAVSLPKENYRVRNWVKDQSFWGYYEVKGASVVGYNDQICVARHILAANNGMFRRAEKFKVTVEVDMRDIDENDVPEKYKGGK